MQVMPLRYKIRMTADRIESWYAHYAHYSLEWADNGPPGVYMSFSGGKDSTVLLHILKNHCNQERRQLLGAGAFYTVPGIPGGPGPAVLCVHGLPAGRGALEHRECDRPG